MHLQNVCATHEVVIQLRRPAAVSYVCWSVPVISWLWSKAMGSQ